jgi:hypothetical protein
VSKWLPFVKITSITIDTEDTDSNLNENEMKIAIDFLVNGQLAGQLATNITL